MFSDGSEWITLRKQGTELQWSLSKVCELILTDWGQLLLTTFYDFLIRHFKKRKKSCFLKCEKNVKYVFWNTVPEVWGSEKSDNWEIVWNALCNRLGECNPEFECPKILILAESQSRAHQTCSHLTASWIRQQEQHLKPALRLGTKISVPKIFP